MSGNKHAYFGAQFLDGLSENERLIFAYTYGGAVHIWSGDNWVSKVTIKGHFGEVTDLDWDPSKECLVTCSLD
jgi:WD40 repeat protein